MSHIVKYSTKINNMCASCMQEALTSKEFGSLGTEFKETSYRSEKAYSMRLNSMRRGQITITESGVISFDTDYMTTQAKKELDQLIQAYNAITYRDEAFRLGKSVEINKQTNGNLQLVIS